MPSSSLLPRIVLGLAILLTFAAGAKSYLNKAALSTAREEAKTAQAKVNAIEAQSKKAIATAKEASEKLKIAEQSKAAAEAKSATVGADVEKAKKEAETIQAQVTAKDAEIASLKQKLTEAASATPAPATPVEDPALAKALEDAKAQAAEKEQLLKTVQIKAEEADKKAATLEAENIRRQQGLARPGLEGKVLAVNPNWSFVVLSIGDRQGVVNGASLIVKRGGNLVAKLRVTSVEPSTSIADIQVGSTAKGATVQPGDVVIFPGS
ncbi:MAG: hypothetical protein NTZ46_00325 [Verrucomicrobia bacterium]|nr:hypothetical protein [Verrucomicrobiota bacterium]